MKRLLKVDSTALVTPAEGFCYKTLGVEFQGQIMWERTKAVIVTLAVVL